jgi:hypothetical protein
MMVLMDMIIFAKSHKSAKEKREFAENGKTPVIMI